MCRPDTCESHQGNAQGGTQASVRQDLSVRHLCVCLCLQTDNERLLAHVEALEGASRKAQEEAQRRGNASPRNGTLLRQPSAAAAEGSDGNLPLISQLAQVCTRVYHTSGLHVSSA